MILVAGLSPAWQQVMRFERIRSGEVNRAAEVQWCASGKAINAAWALKRLGAEVTLLSTAGGSSGAALRRDVENAGLVAHWIETAAATRVCSTLIEAKPPSITELVENTPAATDEELAAFQTLFRKLVAKAELVILTGSLPGGAPSRYYRELLSAAPCPAILDFRGPELWEALEARPLLIKPNREELEFTVGRPLAGPPEMMAAIAELHERGAQWVVVTDGGRPLYASGPRTKLQVAPPSADVVNAIGSGDCLAAGIAWGVHQRMELPEAIRFGVGAAVDNVTHLLPARIDPESVRNWAGLVRSLVL